MMFMRRRKASEIDPEASDKLNLRSKKLTKVESLSDLMRVFTLAKVDYQLRGNTTALKALNKFTDGKYYFSFKEAALVRNLLQVNCTVNQLLNYRHKYYDIRMARIRARAIDRFSSMYHHAAEYIKSLNPKADPDNRLCLTVELKKKGPMEYWRVIYARLDDYCRVKSGYRQCVLNYRRFLAEEGRDRAKAKS